MAAKRGSLGSGLTSVVGGMLVGLDEQLLRSTPRAEILVERGKTVRGLSAQGGTLLVGMPDDPVVIGGAGPGVEGVRSEPAPGPGSHPPPGDLPRA